MGKNFTNWFLFTFFYLNLAFGQAIANCRSDIVATTPLSDFIVHSNGTVTHKTTGLMWMRCSLGQQWDGVGCSGFASRSTWQNGLSTSASFNFAGYNDWRMPNKNELESIIEERCVSPAINSILFPNTPSEWFWSSSRWMVWFATGTILSATGGAELYVRLVRDSE